MNQHLCLTRPRLYGVINWSVIKLNKTMSDAVLCTGKINEYVISSVVCEVTTSVSRNMVCF